MSTRMFKPNTMPSPSLYLILLLSLFLLLPPPLPALQPLSLSPPPPPLSPSPSAACKFTLYPKLCRSILSAFRFSPSSPYDYGRFSVKQCLKLARKTSYLIGRYLNRNQRSTLSHIEAGALDDCRQLSDLNVDYLVTITTELNSAESLTGDLVDQVQTLLSAIVTNQQTCFDGLQASGSAMMGALYAPLSNATQLYSVSLGLVTQALARRKHRGRKRKTSEVERFLSDVNRVWRAGYQSQSDRGKKRSRPCPSNLATRSGGQNQTLAERLGDRILVNDTAIVAKDGSGNFSLIGDAIAFAPNNSKVEDGYFVIYVKEGIYEEYVVVAKNKKNIMLLGDGINRTVVTGNRSVVDGWTTFNSATVAVSGERFVAVDMSFRNTAGPEKHQAVAVRNNADVSTFYRCSFEGYQDTLYAHSLRQFYRECDVYGTVDFIFGNAAAVLQNCNLYARKPMPNQKNAFTAQGRTDPNQNTGISIHNCTIGAAPDLAEDLNSTSNFLGRPWKEYSRTVYMQSYIDSLIDPVGWLEWNGTVGLSTLFYGEFENYGPGAITSMRVQWPGYSLMNASQAWNFTVYNFTMGDTWLPYTDIPFNGGLL
ncbi:PREDICTED: pectinesterase-like isoform X3 [Nelumbo nucifera]|uniref:Pectinesterase n=1 Tax=Nelumbo nucifera TaxID=4432 RepID=A0A1U8Q9P6_NELNU|nr:PREDICTED: pectinesterase-like isoform X3 [Nelumbo nucifera]